MALQVGDQQATLGMTQAIYDQIRAAMEPDLGDLSEQELEGMREGWRKLSFAIASGVISHILSNMEICGIETTGDVGNWTGVTFTQSNDGTGLVN
jgi:hypothetical protein